MNPDYMFNWDDEDTYWRMNYQTRPYTKSAGHGYDFYQPGYRYGSEAAHRFTGKSWHEVESELSKGWNSFKYRSQATWEQVKDAVRDAWDRVTNNYHVHAH